MIDKYRFRTLLKLPVANEIKINAVRDWAKKVTRESRPRDIFSLMPERTPLNHKNVQYLKVIWGREFYIWADDVDAGITDVPPAAWSEVMGTTGPWPTLDELRKKYADK